ncbi:NarK/NasA family nitrate transporter [Apibacter muscae]|uniref:MFS transporter n=1 Tax=Apibacter muscae TaxID=2509004 RepID=UPI0011ADF418|nr:MFS transporter [Apibacter muscae]TWP23765.1 NarK/NasA family nitrate transporter [Apibacter muscae]
MATWLKEWNPEDSNFWESKGKKIAWRTLIITTISLTLSFIVWYLMSGIVTKLTGVGFKFTEKELFWLASLPGLAAGTLRIVHTFLIPIYGTRHTITISTLIKLIPVVGIAFAVMDPSTPFWVFAILAFTMGFGGGDFSSFMPSTNMFFPARLKGTALGIQAGIGNFGVSIVQFLTPALLGVAIVGAPQILKTTNSVTQEVISKPIYLQSTALIYVPLLIVMTLVCWFGLKSIPLKSSFKEQMGIFKQKHTWFCTITYFMTFGTFSGLAAAFPLMIKSLYGDFPGAPDPLKYAFYGPLIGSASRVAFGFVADKVGGAILTTITGVGFIICIGAMIFMGSVSPTSMEQFPSFLAMMLTIFFFSGIGNAGTFRQFPIIFKSNAVHAAGVIGWTAAIAAYGPFIFSLILGSELHASELAGRKSANGFFWGVLIFSIIATWVNWYYYQRKGAERPS